MSEILTRLRGYNPPDRTEWTGRLIAQDISDAADEIDRLHLALDTATRERDEAVAHDSQPYPTAAAYEAACAARDKWQERAEGCADLLETAERERDEARIHADSEFAIATSNYRRWMRAEAKLEEALAKLAASAPPADAATEAAIRKHRSTLLQGLAYIACESWWPDDASVTDGVRAHVGRMRDAVDALSSPAPAPSAKETRCK